MRQIAPHIKNGIEVAKTLKEDDIRVLLLKRIAYVIERNRALNSFLYDLANWGGTFGEWYGEFDTGPQSQSHIVVKLRDGRKFKFSKTNLFNNQQTQGVLL